jgi:hypothetical protein
VLFEQALMLRSIDVICRIELQRYLRTQSHW